MNTSKWLQLTILCILKAVSCKYLEGELKTHENWAFLARFCFLSEHGEFEYRIEFNEEQGNPNLLLYYDTEDQWPSVYKTNKTCYDKESVLNIEQNQIINLTTKYPGYRDLAGCIVTKPPRTTVSPRYTISVPTQKPKKVKPPTHQQPRQNPPETKMTTTVSTIATSTVYESSHSEGNYYISTTSDYSTSEGLSENFTDVSETQFDAENIHESYATSSIDDELTTKAPIKKRSIINSPTSASVVHANRVIVCQNARRFQSSRERWWFVAVSNCNSTKGINIKYKILMTNGPPGDYWHEHFSADQFYILPVLMAFSIAYSLLILAIVLCTVELKSRQLLHSTYKLFVLSVIVQFFGVILQTAAYLKFATNGVGAPLTRRFGSMFMGCSETCFLLLMLLLAKGYTTTRGRLPLSASVKLTIFMCLYTVTYICIFIYEAKVFDPGEVLYLYESPAGYGLIILRIMAWLMFIYSTVFTLKHYPEKSNFYYPFNICGTLWFIAGPAFVLSANTYIDKWVRESVVCAVLLLITFGGHLMFLLLTMPSMANQNFPYHVRTTQIGIMEMTGTAGSSTIEHFSHHVYEPTTTVSEQAVIIPLTRRTEEIFGSLYSQHLQSNFARNHQRANIADVPEGIATAQNVAMQNVLTWSLAKNPVLGVPSLERLDRSAIGSANSRQTDRSSHYDETDDLSRRNSTQGVNGHVNEPSQHSSYEYTKEVPIELFTISKMVVKTNNSHVPEN